MKKVSSSLLWSDKNRRRVSDSVTHREIVRHTVCRQIYGSVDRFWARLIVIRKLLSSQIWIWVSTIIFDRLPSLRVFKIVKFNGINADPKVCPLAHKSVRIRYTSQKMMVCCCWKQSFASLSSRSRMIHAEGKLHA